jgi:hypothetical protein
MNSRFHSQRKFNQLASAMKNQVRWHCSEAEVNLFVRWNPLRPFIQVRQSPRTVYTL